jgi:hypothetical protein
MFNLEQSIAQWRRQMRVAGIKPESLDELEGHLREEIERQIKSEVIQQLAFEMAIKAIGQGAQLKKEFQKVGEPLEIRLVKLIGIGCGTFALLFSLWILPFLFSNPTGWMAKLMGAAAVATIVLCWIYNHKFLPAVHSKHLRFSIGLLCCLGGVIGIQLFIYYGIPYLMIHPAGIGIREGRLIVVLLWAWTAMACLGSIGYGLEKSVRDESAAIEA